MVLESFRRVVALYDAWQQPNRATPFRDTLANILGKSPYAYQWDVLRQAFGPDYSELIEAGTRVKAMCGNISYLAAPGVKHAPELMTALPDFASRVIELGDDPHLRSVAIARLLLGWANNLAPEGCVVHCQWIRPHRTKPAGGRHVRAGRRAPDIGSSNPARSVRRETHGCWRSARSTARIVS